MSDPCLFCNKLARLRDLPADELVWQFPHSIALLGPWQYYTGYCVLVSRNHFAELHQVPKVERSAFLDEMVLLSQAIALAFEPRKMNCESLGNQVPHLHWHLFPRRHDDPDALKPVWLALDRAERDEDEKRRLQTSPLPRIGIANRLRDAIRQQTEPEALAKLVRSSLTIQAQIPP
jgi:diadenosine tetraphosphate (Ap4A) HIT family hydrolase